MAGEGRAIALEPRPAVLERLRGEIRRIERRPARREGLVPCGVAEVDAALDGGFRRGGLTELAGGPASGKTAAALSLIAALGPQELAAWVDPRGELYPPAAEALGVDLRRLLLVKPADSGGARGTGDPVPWLAGVWAGEALLASGAFAVVVLDVPVPRAGLRGADAMAKRLQAAVEKGGAIGIWLAAPGASLRLSAAARVELASVRGRVVVRGSRHAG